MFARREALIIAVSATATTILISAVVYIILRRYLRPNWVSVTQQPELKTTHLQPQPDPKRRLNYQFFHRGSLNRTLFNWGDHPTLITDVVENGWSRFAFTEFNPSSSVRPSLFNSLRATNEIEHNLVEETWEVGVDSVDLMQKLQFKINSSGSSLAKTIKLTARMNLPLPGPELSNSFPQEAYFEIMVVRLREKGMTKGDSRDWEKAKLLSQHSDSSVISGIKSSVIIGSRKEGGLKMVLGLSAGDGSTVNNKVPGSYPGSIGFYSDGSVYLSGMKLVYESEKEDWAQTGKVIGCGFDPIQKKVFFTLDSELVHVVHCKSEDFGMPLYPIMGSNIDSTVLINLGQSSFSYAPANAHRTSDPCFTGRTRKSSPDGQLDEYDDSRELFSMGRLDSEWLSHSATVRSTTSNNSHHYNHYGTNRIVQDDDESEAELFEIVLDD